MGTSLDTTIALVVSSAMDSYLGVTVGGAEEIQTDLLINAASQLALTWTGRTTLLSAALTETYPGDNTNILLPYSYPITAVTELYIDIAGKFDGTSGYVADPTTYQVMSRGRISIIGGSFLMGIVDTDSIRLKYTAGYATVPMDLQNAIKELVGFWYTRNKDRRWGINSNTAGNTTNTFAPDIPMSVKSIFNRYRNFMRRVM